ncbi:MAG: hypothetical protein R3F61_38530 [Myxococcota bacterium]
MSRSKQKTDAEVLDALLPAILEIGLDRVTLKELGEVVGLSPATLVQRFGSRIAVIEAALDRSTLALERALQHPEAPGEDPREALITWLAELAAPLSERRRLVGTLEVLGRDIVVPERNQRARHHLGLVRLRIERGLTAMGVPPDAAHCHAAAVEAQWHGLVLQWALHGEGALDAWLRRGLHSLLAHLP